MSDLYYSTRLRFTELSRGIAKLHGRVQPIIVSPRFIGIDVAEIDYTPEVHSCRIRCAHEGWRDMTADEIAQADEFLRQEVGDD